MSKIRSDLEGVVIVTADDGTPVVLKAGDEVPAGVPVGEHVTEGADKKPAGRK